MNTPDYNLSIVLKDGRKTGFAEYGCSDGKPVFYFHGLPGSRLEVAHLHQTVIANGYKLIAIDRPGMGLSSLDKKRTILSWVSDVEALADCLKIDKFSILGHSGGAPFVAAVACKIPHRLNGGAIVSGMAPLENPEAWGSLVRGQKILNRAMKAMPWLGSLMMKLTRRMLENPDGIMKKMIAQMPEVDGRFFNDPKVSKQIMDATIEAFRQGVDGASQEIQLLLHPWGFDLEEVTFPLSIWHGVLDKQAPVVHGKLYAKLMPHARLELFEHEGHHSLMRNYGDKILKSICI